MPTLVHNQVRRGGLSSFQPASAGLFRNSVTIYGHARLPMSLRAGLICVPLLTGRIGTGASFNQPRMPIRKNGPVSVPIRKELSENPPKPAVGKTYYKLFYHAVWSTHCREPLITTSVEELLPTIFNDIAGRFNFFIHAQGGTEDHVHVVLTVPPNIPVSDAIGKLKGSSSHSLNHHSERTTGFCWQDGFGIRSISERELPRIIRNVQNQHEHHRVTRLFPEYEKDTDEL